MSTNDIEPAVADLCAFLETLNGHPDLFMITFACPSYQETEIETPDLRVLLSGRKETLRVLQIEIPGLEIHLFKDKSGPSVWLWVDGEWDAARWRTHPTRYLSKYHGEPRTYIIYKGAADPSGTRIRPGRRNPYLVHTNDSGREYTPEPTTEGRRYGWSWTDAEEDGKDAPPYLCTSKVLEAAAAHVRSVIARLAGGDGAP